MQLKNSSQSPSKKSTGGGSIGDRHEQPSLVNVTKQSFASPAPLGGSLSRNKRVFNPMDITLIKKKSMAPVHPIEALV